MQQVIAAGSSAAVIMLSVTGCSALEGSSATTATCDDYVAADFHQQGDMQRSLLKAHDLDDLSIDNALGLTTALEDYCGSSLVGHQGGHAQQHGSARIDQAVNWTQVASAGRWPQ
ncbi:MAG: hypothetical protein JWR11_20 [Mycobacterium sp.]|nr:hypothetical protein [Mycobacterium sp.]